MLFANIQNKLNFKQAQAGLHFEICFIFWYNGNCDEIRRSQRTLLLEDNILKTTIWPLYLEKEELKFDEFDMIIMVLESFSKTVQAVLKHYDYKF